MRVISLIFATSLALLCTPSKATDSTHNGGCGSKCCPGIVKDITAFSGYRADTAVIVHWGNCSVDKEEYQYRIEWGDGSVLSRNQTQLGPFEEQHQYSYEKREYVVVVEYCSRYSEPQCKCCDEVEATISVDWEARAETV